MAAALDRPRNAAVALLVAPAGYGKTSLVAGWLATHPWPVAWVTLEESDDAPSRLVETLLAAVVAAGLTTGSQAGPLLDADPPVPGAALGAALARDLAAAAPDLVLVLDDLHTVQDAETLAVIRGLLAAQTPGVQVVLASRRELPALWDADGLDGRLVEVGVEELRLDLSEAAALAGRLEAPPSPEVIERALVASGGWPAAFRLMLTAGGGERLAEVEPSIDWLVASACAVAPRALVARLTYGSVATGITDELLDAIVPESAGIREGRLAAAGGTLANLLVTTYGDAGWYRVHQLVREALERRLIAEYGREAWRAAHAAASAWFEGVGDTFEAVRHALAYGDEGRAGDLVERAGFTALDTERWDVLERLMAATPESVAAQRPGILVLRCWRSYHRPSGIFLDDLQRATEALARWPIDDERRRWRASLDVIDTFFLDPTPPVRDLVARTEAILAALPDSGDLPCGILVATTGFAVGVYEGIDAGREYLRQALAATPSGRPAMAANILGGLAMLLELSGADPNAAEEALEQLLAFGRQADLPGSRSYATIGLGWRALERLDLDGARAFFAEASAIEPGPAFNSWRWLRGGEALLALLSGDGDAATAIAADMVRVVEAAGRPDFVRYTRSFEARIWLAMSRIEAVRDWARIAEPVDEFLYFMLRESEVVTRLRAGAMECLAGVAAPAMCDAEIARVVALAEHPQVPAWCRDAIGVVQAQWLWHTGEHDRAVDTLLPIALRAAAHRNLLSLVEPREEMRPLLEACIARGLDEDFGRRVIVEIDRLDARWPNPLRLRGREREVLALMAQPLSFDDIAAQLFISPVTVRTHAHRIYVRLGVNKRRLAVERAKSLGVLPD